MNSYYSMPNPYKHSVKDEESRKLRDLTRRDMDKLRKKDRPKKPLPLVKGSLWQQIIAEEELNNSI